MADQSKEGKADETETPLPEIPLDPESLNLPFVNNEPLQDNTDWSKIDLEDFGANFEPIEDDEPLVPRKKVDRSTLNRFLLGRSRFVHYVLNPKVRKYTPKKTTPINANTKVTKKEQQRWNTRLVKNIGKTSQFFQEELLPITSALATATWDAQERYGQLISDPSSKLPAAFILKKANLAAQLRIMDHLSDLFSLSAQNRKIMKAEFLKTLGVVLTDPKGLE